MPHQLLLFSVLAMGIAVVAVLIRAMSPRGALWHEVLLLLLIGGVTGAVILARVLSPREGIWHDIALCVMVETVRRTTELTSERDKGHPQDSAFSSDPKDVATVAPGESERRSPAASPTAPAPIDQARTRQAVGEESVDDTTENGGPSPLKHERRDRCA
jgi:hypothetical protein